jgi:putative hydrolase of the HAD superfamily
VLLDVGETLLAPRESFAAIYARVLSEIGFDRDREVFETALGQAWQEMSRLVPAGVDRYGHFPGGEAEYWLRFAGCAIERSGGAAPSPVFLEQALDRLREVFLRPESWQVYPEVEATLGSLKRDGARLAVVSNWDSRLHALLEVLGLASYFDAIVVSCETGFEKPSPVIFAKALEALGADPRSTLHVGDVPELDLEGARAAGIDAVLVDRRGRYPARPERLGDLGPLPRLAREGMDEGRMR